MTSEMTSLIAALDDEIDYLRDDGSDMEHAVANSLSRIRDTLARDDVERMRAIRSCNCGASEMRGRVDHLAWCDAAEGV